MSVTRPITSPVTSPVTSRVVGTEWRRRRGGVSFDYYVDSVNGDDTNAGDTLASAFETLNAAEGDATNGTSIGLARGSVWRDSLNFESLTDVRVGVVGTGDVPVINCADIATGWTQPDAATYPNVWYLPAWISECINGNFSLTVFEDDKELPNVTSLALVNATPGRSFVTTTPDGNDAVYVHATGSGNPNTNGSIYEVSKRHNPLRTASVGNLRLTVEGPLELRNSPWASGALHTAENATIRRVLTRNSRRGMFLVSGLVEDVLFNGASHRFNSGNSNYLVFFTSTAGTYPGTARRCGFLPGNSPDNTTWENTAALFSHNDMPGVTHNCDSEQCWFVDVASAGGFRGGAVSHVAPYLLRTGGFNLQFGTTRSDVPITYGLFNGGIANTSLTGWDAIHSFYHCCAYDCRPIRTAAGFDIHNSVWISTNGSTGPMTPISTGINNIDVRNSVFLCTSANWIPCIDLSGNTGYTGDYNIFASYFTGRQMRTRIGGVTYQTLAEWQTATSGEDANSVYILPADQVAGGANALWLGYTEAAGGTDLATIGPAIGDFRINPNARVYGGNNTAYIGTYADGTTPITEAGPQMCWNWNTRAAVAGPPTRWPVVPITVADSRTYINDPESWNFYP